MIKSERTCPPYPRGDPRASAAGKKGGAVTAAARRAATTPYSGTIIDLMDAVGMTATDWTPWRAFFKALYALGGMTPEELALYRKHTKRELPPVDQCDAGWLCIGRGAGKTRCAALHAVFRAISFDSTTVAPGESVTIPLLASDRDQSGAALRYVRGFNEMPCVAPYVARGDLASRAEYKTGCDIVITTASFKAPRGRTSPTCCADEIAFWDDGGVSPDEEILLAVAGTLGRVVGSVLLVLSNPYAPRGELHKASEQYFGNEKDSAADGVLFWNASTLAMRPSHPPRPIARLWKSDPVKAASEYGSDDGYVTFRQGDQAMFDLLPVSGAIVRGRREQAAAEGVRYMAFLDAAEGSRSGDSMTLGIAHKDGARAVLDLVREVVPPFSPGNVIVTTFAPILEAYGIRKVSGDRHAVGFVSAFLRDCGVLFEPTTLTKSELYIELLALLNTGAVELLENATLRTQLLALQRHSMRGGRDSVDHPSGQHDDVANVAAGALVLVSGVRSKKKQVRFSVGPPYDTDESPKARNPHDEMRELIARTNAGLERQDERDWEIQKQFEDAPMTSAPVWHVHSSK